MSTIASEIHEVNHNPITDEVADYNLLWRMRTMLLDYQLWSSICPASLYYLSGIL